MARQRCEREEEEAAFAAAACKEGMALVQRSELFGVEDLFEDGSRWWSKAGSQVNGWRHGVSFE